MSSCFCGESDCLNRFAFFADSTITYKEDVAAFDFNCDHLSVAVVQCNTVILGGESNCLERLVCLHRCDGYQKTESYLFR